MQYPTPRKRREQVIRFRVRWCPSTRCRSIDDRATGDGESCQRDADQKPTMTNETNHRTKANAVFFAAIMVVSMVAVGFAAAPRLRLLPESPVTSQETLPSGTVQQPKM